MPVFNLEPMVTSAAVGDFWENGAAGGLERGEEADGIYRSCAVGNGTRFCLGLLGNA